MEVPRVLPYSPKVVQLASSDEHLVVWNNGFELIEYVLRVVVGFNSIGLVDAEDSSLVI